MVFAIYTIFISFSHSPSEVTIIIPVYGWANWSLTRSCPIAEWWSCHSKWEFLLYTVSCICPIRGALPRPCWVMPCQNFCVCWASAFSERPGPVWSSAVQQERAGCRPHSPLSVETPCSTISLVKPSPALPYKAASFPGQLNNPQGLAAGTAISRGVYMSENVPGYK